ncbi:MAG: sodium:solute symporter family transporter, partial [Ignavibacteriaceae bacterium]
PFIFTGMVGAAIYAPGTIAEPAVVWARLVHQFSPPGLTGIIVAGIFAAYMSCISAEMNMGSSYLINDLYKRFLKRDGTDKHYVLAARVSSILLFGVSLIVALYLVKGMQSWFLFINSVVFAFILPLSWLRFFWWRLNIYGEASALIIGLPLGYIVWFPLGFSTLPFWQGFLLLFGLGWITIVIVTLLTRPEKIETLEHFYELCKPPGFWGPVTKKFSDIDKRKIRKETINDLIDCFIAIISCACVILVVISLFGRNFPVFIYSLLILIISSGTFVYRWKRKGIFTGLKQNWEG